MRTSSAILCVLVAACGGKKDEAKKQPPKPIVKHTIDGARMKVPEGWTSEYNAEQDTWHFASAAGADGHETLVSFERTPPETTPSPDALLHVMKTRTLGPDVTAAIVKREALSDGFATIIETTQGASTAREIYVVKELGSEWFLCASTGADETTRDQALALCKSIKR